jgi:NADH-quinone oxidoreductase subunit E
MFSMPEDLMPDVKTFEVKTIEMTAMLPREMASAVNLFVHPLAGMAAASAIGIGVASQMFGLWMGAMSGMAAASQHLLAPLEGEPAKDTAGAGRRAASSKAKTAAKVLIEETRSTALEIAGPDAAAAPRVEPAPVATEAVGELQPEDFRQPRSIAKPRKADDLKAISGIGPKLEKVLNDLGVWTYAQIAAWAPEEIAWVDDYLSFKGRIGRDDWIGQAGKLAGNKKR